MSREAVMQLLQQADRDAVLSEQLDRALKAPKGGIASFLATAAAQGCEFTAEEFLDVMGASRAPGAGGELSDQDLEAVAGGLTLTSQTFSLANRAVSLFSSYRAGPGIRQIGPGGILQSEEEEDIQA